MELLTGRLYSSNASIKIELFKDSVVKEYSNFAFKSKSTALMSRTVLFTLKSSLIFT